MRYTTAIDLRDFDDVYRNKNAVLLYFHMCLSAGYHADDRDVLHMSLRRLSVDAGITLSACRNALALLCRHSLLEVLPDGGYRVVKWCSPLPIPKRELVHQDAAPHVETQDERDARLMDDTERRFRAQLDGTPETHEILMLFLYDKAKRGDSHAKEEADAIRQELEKVGYHSKWL